MTAGATRAADLWLSAGLVTLGSILLAGLAAISPGAGYDRIGPRFFPAAVSLGLIALGGALAWPARRPRHDVADVTSRVGVRTNWRGLAAIVAALLFTVLLLDRAGFVPTAALQFFIVARAFHSRRPARDALAALLVSVAVYVLFSKGLGLTLPRGPFAAFD
jgi:putative tricarboxylic transport membrane protein